MDIVELYNMLLRGRIERIPVFPGDIPESGRHILYLIQIVQ